MIHRGGRFEISTKKGVDRLIITKEGLIYSPLGMCYG